MTPIDSRTAENLLAHRQWLHNLARRLVRDEDRAEDVCQETMIEALQRPVAVHAVRPLLARIARSFAARFGREEHRRRRREAAVARRESGPPASWIVEQVANQRAVIDAVMALDEPYRTTILLRYWEDLPPREVARAMKAPVETVRTRLKRGLALLRERLDREFGSRRAWVMPITAFVSVGKKSLALASGAAVVKTKSIAVAAVLVAGLVLTWAPWSGPGEAVPGPGAARRPATRAGDGGVGGAPLPVQRSPVRVPGAAAADRTPAREGALQFRGRVVDAEAVPLGGVGVRIRDAAGIEEDDRSAQTDARGYFSLTRPASRREIQVDEAGLATVLAGVVTPGEKAEPVVVAAPALDFGGVVLGDNGERLGGARVSCTLPDDFRARFGHVLDFSAGEPWRARAGEDGAFRLAGLGRVEGSELHFSMDGYLPVTMPQPEMSDGSMQIVLSRPVPVAGALLGQVVDPSGVPVPEAHVSLGRVTTVSDDNGRFTIGMEEAGRNLEIIAMKRGHLPGTYRLREWEGPFQAMDQPFATVRLGGRPLSISGQLLDSEGRPVEGAKVWVDDPMVFGDSGRGLGLISVEGYLAGGLTVSELEARFLRDGRPTMPVEQIMEENATAKWAWAKTDQSGQFSLGGLSDRPYRVSALVPGTLVRVDGGPYPGGTANVRLVIPAGAVLPVVAGRVVSRGGMPVSGVRVQTICDAVSLTRVTVRSDGRQGTQTSGRSEIGRATLTGEDGRFRFENVGAARVYLSLSGDKIMPTSFGRVAGEERARVDRADGRLSRTSPPGGGITASGMPVDDLVIEVSLRLHLRVELADPDLADRVAAEAVDGRRINLSIMSGGGVDSFDTYALHEGRTQVLSAPESVTTLVLYKDGVEVRRIPLTLQPGEVNVIRG